MANKKVATKTVIKGPTDEQLIADAKVNKPWLIPLITDPEHGAVYLQWARDAANGKAPSTDQIRAKTYNWDITQVWSANQAKLFNLSLTNPGEYKTQQEATSVAVDKYIEQSGNKVDPATRQELINDIFLKGWAATDPRIAQIVSSKFNVKEATSGTALTALDQVNKLAQDYMIPITPDVAQKWASAIQQDPTNLTNATDYFKKQAAGQYQFLAGTLDHITPTDWFAPAKTLISTNLDIPVTSIDFNDPSGKWMALVTKKDPATGATIARSNSEIIKEARTNPTYGYDKTQGAIDSAYALGSQIRSMMGFGA